MIFRIQVAAVERPETPWYESYDKPAITTLGAAVTFAEDIVAYFNRTLRPGESRRKLISVVEGSNEKFVASAHEWEKKNLVTLSDSTGLFDVLACRNCPVTARRYGISDVRFDQKFRRAKKFQRCSTSKAKS